MKVEDFDGTVKDRDWRNTMRPSCPLTNITKAKGGKVTYDAKKKKKKKSVIFKRIFKFCIWPSGMAVGLYNRKGTSKKVLAFT